MNDKNLESIKEKIYLILFGNNNLGLFVCRVELVAEVSLVTPLSYMSNPATRAIPDTTQIGSRAVRSSGMELKQEL